MKIHRSLWVRLSALLLLLCLALPLMSCEDDIPMEDADLKFVSMHGYSVYSVVYSETTATPELVAAATALRNTTAF